MPASFNAASLHHFFSGVVLVLCSTLINGFLLFVIVSLIVRRIRNMAAKHRHIIWLFVLYCFVTIPFLSILMPSTSLQRAGLPVVEALRAEANQGSLVSEAQSPEPSRASEELVQSPSPKTGSAVEPPGVFSLQHWHILIVLVWLAGVLISLLRVLIGRIGLHCIIRKAVPVSDSRFSSMVHDLSAELGIRRKVHLWQSVQCITPFTCFIFKPVILLPTTTHSWSEERLQAVFLHELAHIRRRDHISRWIARIICAFLWFVPPVWIAYRNMQIEEEKACDATVVSRGIRVSDYAAHIIDIARSTRGRVLSMMLQHSFGGRSFLEPRIRNILRLREARDQARVRVLLRVLLLCFVVLLSLHMVNPLSAWDDGGVSSKKAPVELLYGRWFYIQWMHVPNPHPLTLVGLNNCIGKMVVDPEGTYHIYMSPTSPEYPYIGENGSFTVEESFVDRQGYSYYRVITDAPYGPYRFYHVWRVGPLGSTMELTWHHAEFPEKINPNSFAYAKLRRSRAPLKP
jgi:beta-lactamase regulating signal transducer with metallopeptidase domain